jgi:hypothetical protein
VIAYEANPEDVAILRDNVAMNWLDDRVEIVPHAAAAGVGGAQLRVPQRFRMLSTIHAADELLVSGYRTDTLKPSRCGPSRSTRSLDASSAST